MSKITKKRKNDHINVCLERDVEYGYPGFKDIHFIHNPLPEIDFNEIDTKISLFERKFDYPILIEGMTGGSEKGYILNRRLSEVAKEYKIPMGIGSQRAALENPKLEHTYNIREHSPDIFLIGNIGIGEKYSVDKAKKAVEMVNADALAVHLNVTQELVQPEGDRNFKGIKKSLKEICNKLGVPIIAKGTGAGISKETAKTLEELGVSAIDVGGRGGTNFSLVEAYRVKNNKDIYKSLGKSFADLGIPTAISVAEVKSVVDVPIVASGGLRSGLDLGKSIVLGAEAGGFALPLFKTAYKGIKETKEQVNKYIEELKRVMLLTESKNIKELKNKELIILGKTKEWLNKRKINY